jgi:serine/threonine protein kinase
MLTLDARCGHNEKFASAPSTGERAFGPIAMNDPARPHATPTGDQATDTHGPFAEATGSPAAPAPSATGSVTTARGAAPALGDAGPPLTDYRIVQKLGEGGMGAVYLAEDAKLGRKVAIKTMRPELAAQKENRDRFAREARAAATVESDYIVPILHVGEASDGTPFIAMPFLKGEMLDSRIKREPVTPLGVLVKVAREVSDGLAAAHAAGLIHRDIKPGNIWLEGDLSAEELGRQIKRCKILDFGLARSVDKDDANLTASGAILGTPAYMAPEQARGEKVDHRADLFSLGVTLYRMATGQGPFKGANAMAVLISLVNETPPPVRTLRPDLPPALANLIDQLMCKDASGRPQSAAEVATTVRQLVKDIQANRAGPAPIVQTPPLPSAVEASGSAPRVLPVASDEDTARHAWESATSNEPDGEADDGDDEPVAAPARSSSAPRMALLIVAAVLGLGLLAWGASTLLLTTPEGTLTVEINDPEVEARFKDGKLVLVGPDGKARYTLSAERSKKIDAGSYAIRVEGAVGLVVDTSEFSLKKGDKVTVRVTFDPKVAKKPEPKKKDVPASGSKAKGPSDEADGFVSIFNGKDLTGWTTAQGGRGNWKVVDGAITCAGQLDHLYTESSDFGDFHLRAEVKLNALGNSGIYFRAGKPLGLVTDYEAQISTRADQQKTGSLYNLARVNQSPVAGDTWFTYEIIARGDRIRLLVNGTETAAYTETRPGRPRTGYIALQHHDPNTTVQFRKIEVRRLDAMGVADRKAAEYALSVGGAVMVDGAEKSIKDRAELPKEPFRLTGVGLGSNTKVADADLAVFKDCAHIALLSFYKTPVSNAGLKHFENCANLTGIDLGDTLVTDAALEQIKSLTKLTRLNVAKSKVTAKGVAELAKALPGCTIVWDGGTIEPKK